MQRLLFDVWQDVENPTARLSPVVVAIGVSGPGMSPSARRETAVGFFMAQAAEGELLQVVFALYLSGRLTGRLDRRQKQRD